jgi:hypothetical protein
MLCCLEIMLGAVLPGAHAAQDLLDLLKPWGQDIVRILRSGGGQFTTRVATFTLSTGAGAFSPNTTIGSFDTVMVFLEATSSERPPSATPRAQVAATTAGSASSPRATNVDACRFPDCDRLLAGVPDSYSGHDANVDGNYDLGVCVSARRLRTTDNDLLRGAAYYSLGRAWWYKGCALKAREAFNRSLCVRPTHRNPTVIETVRNGCLEVGLGPCTGCGSSGPDPTSP